MGARCADVRGNGLVVVRRCCVPACNDARYYIVRNMCLHLVVVDRFDQPMPVALGCCTIINWLAATISVCVAYVVEFSMKWR